MTNFGKFCRKLRIDRAELLYDMAQRLGVSSAFLSKVENGRAKPPIKWKNTIAYEYGLDNKEKEKLSRYIDEARIGNVIELGDMSEDDRDIMLKFARKLSYMDEESKQLVIKLVNEQKGEEDY
jgi:transcriptional regulator with XRE-family HTH domain